MQKVQIKIKDHFDIDQEVERIEDDTPGQMNVNIWPILLFDLILTMVKGHIVKVPSDKCINAEKSKAQLIEEI